MLKRRNKHFALLLVLAMLASMFIGLGTASAATNNTVVGVVPTIAAVTVAGTPVGLGSLQIDEAAIGNFVNPTPGGLSQVLLTLPTGVNFNAAYYGAGLPLTVGTEAPTGTTTATATATLESPQVLRVLITPDPTETNPAVFTIPIVADVTQLGSGGLSVNVLGSGNGVQSGDYVVGQFVTGSAVVAALNTVASGKAFDTYGTLRIQENTLDALKVGQTITLKIPSAFSWGTPTVNVYGSSTLTLGPGTGGDAQTLVYQVLTASTDAPAIIDITTPITTASGTTPQNITVNVGGTANISGSVIIGSTATYGITVTADAAPTIQAGVKDQKIAATYITENIPASLIGGRSLTLSLPSNAAFEAVPSLSLLAGNGLISGGGFSGAFDTNNMAGTSTYGTSVTYTLGDNSTSAAKIVIQNVLIKTAANANGPISLTVGGTAGATGSVVVANVTPTISMSAANVTTIQPGTTSNAVADVTLTENVANTINNGANNQIKLTCYDGFTFAGVPTVAVTAGDLTISSSYGTTTNNIGDTFIMLVNTKSSVASTIKISNIKLNVASYVPTGDVNFSVGGTATGIDTVTFPAVTSIGKIKVATVSNVQGGSANTAVFTVGSTSYTINGATATAFAAPYVKNGRTYMAIRDFAAALGITQANVLWDGVKNSVTMIKGDKVVQVTLGSTTMLINGAPVTMDVAPEAPNDRAMLPAAWLASAFGSTATWDATAQTVTLK